MIWNFCIRRPVLTVVVFLVIAIFGFYSFRQLPVREMPDVDNPVVSVSVTLLWAEPEVIETEIIEPLEEELNTIEGLKTLRSTARDQVGVVRAEFELWRDIDIAAQDVRDRVNRALRRLPNEAESPLVIKLDPDARPIMWVAVTGDDRWDSIEITEYVRNVLKERLEGIRGVGRIQIGGERRFAVRVKIDPARLAAHRLTVQDVVTTIRENNVDIPSGRIESQQREFTIKVSGQFADPEPINNLIITHIDGSPVRIGDVGSVEAGIENDRQLARHTRERAVGLGIIRQSDANTVALANAVKERMEELSKNFPPGLTYRISSDSSKYVQENIDDLINTIFIATGLVFLVVLLFLRSGSGTIITTLAIPTSLLGGMVFVYLFGFTLNTLTMLGLILVIGIVVDDAIVVLESTYRHMEKGTEAKPAARVGTTEVAFAAVANSLSLCAVFIPVAFTQGQIGRFFNEFGLTVAVTVLMSTFTALTLTPMLCSRMLKAPERHGRLFNASEKGFRGMEKAYQGLLNLAFRAKLLTLFLGALAFAGGLWFLNNIEREFSPSVDRDGFMIVFETPEGSTLGMTDALARKIEQILKETPEVESQFLAIGMSQGGPGQITRGMTFINLTPRKERERHQTEVLQEVRQKLAQLPDGRAFAMERSVSGPIGGGSSLEVVLLGTELERLAEVQEEVIGWMNSQPEYIGIQTDLKMNKPQINLEINRDQASEMGISVADISNTLRFLLGEPNIGDITRGNKRYEIITEVGDKGNQVPDNINQLYVRGKNGQLVSMSHLVSIREAIGPSEINRYNRIRSATISANTPPDVVLGRAMDKLQAHLAATLPSDMEFQFTGQAQDYEESYYYLTLALIFSIVFIYLILAAQFESWIDPLIILVSLPLATLGAFGTLWYFGMTLNIFSFIGLIMLLGMASKNAILLVDYTNVLVQRGYDVTLAAKEAAVTRFRPVLMTAVSTMLGMLPIALGYGAGGEARAPLGVSVAAGLFTSTLLTLLVVPVLFAMIIGSLQRLKKRFIKNSGGRTA